MGGGERGGRGGGEGGRVGTVGASDIERKVSEGGRRDEEE